MGLKPALVKPADAVERALPGHWRRPLGEDAKRLRGDHGFAQRRSRLW